MAWKHNNAPHRNALNFGKPTTFGLRIARHAKGQWHVFPIPHSIGEWRAERCTIGDQKDLGVWSSVGLAMSACARDCKEQP